MMRRTNPAKAGEPSIIHDNPSCCGLSHDRVHDAWRSGCQSGGVINSP